MRAFIAAFAGALLYLAIAQPDAYAATGAPSTVSLHLALIEIVTVLGVLIALIAITNWIDRRRAGP